LTVERDAPLLLCLLAWVVLLAGMLGLRRRGSGPVARRDRRSLVGLGIQALAFTAMFNLQRRPSPSPALLEHGLRWGGVLLSWASCAVALRAVQVLGRHWSLQARLLPGHELVRAGPYACVRHPIYSAMLGLMLGTGANVTPWGVLAAAAAVYVAGTLLRVRAEEELLRQQFGDAYESYARTTGALVPRLRTRRSGTG
jgi:protein-S-isoprenylcysteine O-methyltransferase Ste14